MIKVVVLRSEEPVWNGYYKPYIWVGRLHRFTKYIAENGNAVCTVDGEIVEPNEGNDTYRKLKAKGAVCTSRETWDMNDSEIVEYIERGIDKFTHYIDNYKQQQQAEANNDSLYKLSSEFKRVAGM